MEFLSHKFGQGLIILMVLLAFAMLAFKKYAESHPDEAKQMGRKTGGWLSKWFS